jgi:molybdopterin-guanine dinucleotide biosynthesis protein B
MEMDRENTDTWKHKEAGSNLVVGVGNRTFFNLANDLPLERILFLIQLIDSPDFVVIEGFKDYSYPKIATSPELEDEFTLETVDAIAISDDEIAKLVDKIEKNSYDIIDTLYTNECGFNDGKSIAKAIIKDEINYKDTNFDKDVSLSINEKVIGLNFFVNDFLKNSIIGMLKSLKTEEFGVEEFEKIEIVIKNEDK